MADQPIFEEVMSSQVEVLEAERRLHKLEAELGEAPTPQQLAAAGRARDAYEVLGGLSLIHICSSPILRKRARS